MPFTESDKRYRPDRNELPAGNDHPEGTATRHAVLTSFEAPLGHLDDVPYQCVNETLAAVDD